MVVSKIGVLKIRFLGDLALDDMKQMSCQPNLKWNHVLKTWFSPNTVIFPSYFAKHQLHSKPTQRFRPSRESISFPLITIDRQTNPTTLPLIVPHHHCIWRSIKKIWHQFGSHLDKFWVHNSFLFNGFALLNVMVVNWSMKFYGFVGFWTSGVWAFGAINCGRVEIWEVCANSF